ncbi:MAG: RNA polymerase sigma factor [Polyangiaceae bacterium]
MTTTSDLLSAVKQGDSKAFDALFAEHVPKLRGVLRRMVGHPDDVDDLTQQALMRAYEGIDGFRGDSSAGTWLCSIGARLAIDHLRGRKRWRERAQVIFASRCLEAEELGQDVGAALSDPHFTYQVNEHIAYCFTCVGRTLEPEAQAALVLRDVLELGNDEAANALGMTRSVLRHHLARARDTMTRTYDGLCALVSKQGACWQCAGLREASPEGHKGPAVPEIVSWEERLAIVRSATTESRQSRPLHDTFFRHTEVQEQERLGDENAKTDCGVPGAGDGGVDE